jgi:hypothetical protein
MHAAHVQAVDGSVALGLGYCFIGRGSESLIL